MQTKTLAGPNIQAALKKARHELGEDVVLIESSPSSEDDPAQVTVMVDEALPEAKNGSTQDASSRNVQSTTGSSSTSTEAKGYAPSMQRTTQHGATTRGEGSVPSDFEFLAQRADPSTREAARNLPDPSSGRRGNGSPEGRGQLFPSGNGAPAEDGASSDASAEETAGRLLESHLQLLYDRLEDMERRFGSAVIGANQKWVAHPLYTHLLKQGLRADTLNMLFESLVDRGFSPNQDTERLQWAIAQELRRKLATASPQNRCQGGLLVMGPSGSGKTSLLLKLAEHDNFFGRRRTSVISVVPDDLSLPYQNPAALYQRFGLPVQNVRSAQEMDRALQRAQEFDNILIDTPPLPIDIDAAQERLRRLQDIVAPVLPLQTHLVLNATRTFDAFDPDYLEGLPIRPDSVALTHLDETTKWGRVAEWLLDLEKPIHFVSVGPTVPDGVASFSPSWYVEQLMDLDPVAA